MDMPQWREEGPSLPNLAFTTRLRKQCAFFPSTWAQSARSQTYALMTTLDHTYTSYTANGPLTKSETPVPSVTDERMGWTRAAWGPDKVREPANDGQAEPVAPQGESPHHGWRGLAVTTT